MNANHLEELAEMLLARINSGEMEFVLDDLQVGVSKETAHWKLREWVGDLPPAEDVAVALKAIPTERWADILSAPEKASEAELTMWLTETGDWDQLFCLGSVCPLTDSLEGPCAIIGTSGDTPDPDYEIFLVASTRAEASSFWARNWLH